MTGLDSLGTLPGILNYSEILKYSIELEIQESINSLRFCILFDLSVDFFPSVLRCKYYMVLTPIL